MKLSILSFAMTLAACGPSPGGPDADIGDADGAPADAGPAVPIVGAPLAGLTLHDGWTDPRALAGINTTGWEDSAFIAPDGRQLYFGYTRLDFDRALAGEGVMDGPHRDGERGDHFDVYEAALGADAWQVTNSTMNAGADVPEAAQSVDRTRTEMVFARFVGDADLWTTARASAEGDWGPTAELPAPVNTPCVEDNPHITSDGEWLVFDSDRADAIGTSCKAPGQPRDLWIAARDGAGWAAPELVAGEPNTAIVRFQPFATTGAAELYWSGVSADCAPAGSCVHRATRQPDGSYTGAVLVAAAMPTASAADGDVVALGEISITEDGHWMYFVYIQRIDADTSDVSIGVAHR